MLQRLPGLTFTAIIIATIVAIPVITVLWQALFAGTSTFSHLASTVLSDYVINSLLLMVGVTVGTLAIGVPAAWFAAMCDFPGRRWLDWGMLLPLAMPAYVIAYTYTGLLDFAGPIQTTLRNMTGWGYGDYRFWDVRSLSGAIAMLVLVLYPYVYLTARATFLEQSNVSINAARSLGYTTWQAWYKVAVPMARPAIVAGVTLALMETLADYGTVKFFGVQTFSTGIFRTFFGFGDSAAAAQLASMLLLFVATLILIERYSRRRMAYHVRGNQGAIAERIQLKGWHATFAMLACFVPFFFGFLLPAGQLLYWSLFEANLKWDNFIELSWNSFYLAGLAALLATSLALLLAYAKRFSKGPVVQSSIQVASLGYALPGTIIAIGVMIPLVELDHLINDLLNNFELDTPGLLLSGGLLAVMMAYAVRFLAVALSSIQSGLGQISPSLDEAAKSMGKKPFQVLGLIHIPLMRSSVITALLVVFVDVLKELPATLMLRPFDFNTLAVRAHELASDEQLIEAAPPSLMIVAVGLLPVLLLNRAISHKKS